MNKKLVSIIVALAFIVILTGTFFLAQDIGYNAGWIEGYGKGQQETLAGVQAILDKGGVIFNYTQQPDGSYIIQIMRTDGNRMMTETASISASTFNVLDVKYDLTGSVLMSFTVGSIHATITMYKDGVKVFEQYHAGSITNLGANLTLAKLTGYFTSAYNGTTYTYNLTSISIGDQGTLNAASTVLPGEWNRTAATIHDCTYNSFNLTAVFYPDTGPYTADCLGINYEAGVANNALWGYDTFSEVSGIDDTFTITVEAKLTVA